MTSKDVQDSAQQLSAHAKGTDERIMLVYVTRKGCSRWNNV